MSNLNARNVFGDQTLEIPCPSCDHGIKVKAKQVMSPNSVLHCPHCKQTVHVDGSKFRQQGDQAMRELEQMFKKFGR